MSSESNNTSLAVRQNAIIGISIPELSEVSSLIFNSHAYADIKSKEAAAVKIMAGLEHGFSAMQSLSLIDFIQGKPDLNAHAKATKINSSGKYRLNIKELTNKNCTIEVERKNGDKWESASTQSFSWEDAVKAGYTTGPNKHNYDKIPRNMLFARCVSNIFRWVTPELRNMRLDRVQEFAAQELEDELAGETAPTAAPPQAAAEPEVVDYIDAEVIETTDGDQVDTSTGEVVAEAAPQAEEPVATPEPTPAAPASEIGQAAKAATDLAKKLQKDHGVEAEALAMQFLPEGVDLFSKLSEEQAQAVIPGLAELLNSKIKAAKG